MNQKADKYFIPIIACITGVCITVTAFVFKQDLFIIIPLYISLMIMLLQSRANRFCFLLGGLNSILYALVYFHTGLYATAAYALLVSMTFQLVTFFRWSKRPYGNSTIFKTLGMKKRLLLAAAFAIFWLLAWAILSALGSDYLLFDNTISLLGIVGSVLSILSYLDFGYIQIISTSVSIFLYASMMRENPIQLTYLIYNIYALICCTKSLIRMNQLYREQKKAGWAAKNSKQAETP